jgi:transposase
MRQLLIDVDPFDLSPPYPFDLSPPSMVGRRISDEVRQMALSMSLQGIPDSEVHEYTGISVRSIKRLRSAHRRAGEVLCKSLVHGRPRSLTSMQSQFLCDCVKRTPDMALAELKTELQEVCGVDVSISTIARTLQRQGFTMKTVCFFFSCLVCTLPHNDYSSRGLLWSETRRIERNTRGTCAFTTAPNS